MSKRKKRGRKRSTRKAQPVDGLQILAAWTNDKAAEFPRLLASQQNPAETIGALQGGSLTRRGNRWTFRWREAPDGDGHRARRSRVVGTVDEFPTRAEASAEVERLRPYLIAPAVSAGKSPPFAELCERYMASPLRDKALGTIQQFPYVIRNHLVPAFGHLRAHEINDVRIRAFMTAQLEAGTPRKTIKTRRDYLLTILGWAEQVGYPVQRPSAARVRVPRAREAVSTVLDRAWSHADAEQLAEAAPAPLSIVIALAWHTGLRGGECLALDWSRIDVGREREPYVRVRATVSAGHIGPPKTKASVRDVPMTEDLAAILRAYHRDCGRPIGGLLFPGTDAARPRTHSGLLKLLDRLCVDLGIERRGRGLHGFRYRYAQNLADSGMAVGMILKLCGWSDLSSADPYLKASGRPTHAAVERANRAARGARSQRAAGGSTDGQKKRSSEMTANVGPPADSGRNVLNLPNPKEKP